MPTSPRDDIDLKREQIQSLSSADALAGLFAYLGYPSDTRLLTNAKALGLNEELTRAVKRVERLASVEAGALEVYLFELKSVTVGNTRALARAFRDRAGNFLFVLTDDYDRLDFVLVERILPERNGEGITRKGITVRPRVLTVNRRDPDAVALRVLRRFTFTEVDSDGDPDPYAQYEKLQSAYVVAEWSEPLFNNRALFSDYYLNERLRALPEWNDPTRNQAFRDIRRQFANARRRFAGQDGPALRQNLIYPLLETLGFQVEGSFSADSESGPDFRLFTSDVQLSGNSATFVLAYPWNRYLDGKSDNDPERPEENPAAQAVSLLEAGEAQWAIVTNGKIWRLYSARAHSRATNYYEVDLEEILASAAPADPFRYFYLFFRAAAFTPTDRLVSGETRPLGFLDWLMEESAIYARELGERLKERVFEEIFPHLAEGFIHGLGGPKAILALPEAEREARLDDVFHGTLTFLYRLLFLLYAESRDLLPAREVRGYYEISLQQIGKEVAGKAKTLEDQAPGHLKKAYSSNEANLYDRLLALFAVIDKGDASRNVPIYNGGLFLTDPPDVSSNGKDGDDITTASQEIRTARFLHDTKIPDRYLALGLDRLTRDTDPKRGDLVFIDYKSLGVRQLGSIYEGLLEFKVRLAAETMAVVKGKKTEQVVSQTEAKRRKLSIKRPLPQGTVYLENDRRERKATGSYYTPDYIVKYIVQHTVGPVLDEKFDALRPRLDKLGMRFHKQVKSKQNAGVTPNTPNLLTDMGQNVLRDLFDIKVLDPAMGSGHFLVEAVDYITDRLVRFVEGFPFLSHFFAGMRRDILAEMERQAITIDPHRLTDVTLLKRHVLKRSIYGVDLNLMAVELAKVSLWLDCFTLGAPLSFLDHHLRLGNSLIGGQSVENYILPNSPRHNEFMRAVSNSVEIMKLSDVTPSEVEASQLLYSEVMKILAPFKARVNVDVATHFVDLPKYRIARAGRWAFDKAGKPNDESYIDYQTAQQVASTKSFFHWQLEFPEVFIDLDRADWKKDGGFDAVIGNPPWIMVKNLGDEEKRYYRLRYQAAKAKFDAYSLFIEGSLSILSHKKSVGLIVSNKFLRAKYGQSLRDLILDNAAIQYLIDYADLPLFGDATNYPLTLILSNEVSEKNHTFDAVVFKPGSRVIAENLDRITTEFNQNEMASVFKIAQSQLKGSAFWGLTPADQVDVVEKVQQSCSYLNSFCETICQGIWTGKKDVYVDNLTEEFIEKEGLENSLIFPVVDGSDIDRYMIGSIHQKYILYPYRLVGGRLELIDVSTTPKIEAYLRQYRTALEARRSWGKDIVEAGKVWYEIWNPSPHMQKPKILTQDISNRNRFALDLTGKHLAMNTCYALILKENLEEKSLYLLTVLNSNLLNFLFTTISPALQGGFYRYKTQYLERLPIRRIHFTTPEPERQQSLAQLVDLYQRQLDEALLGVVDTLLPKYENGGFLAFAPDATGAEEQSDVVHDLLAYLAQQMIDRNKQKQTEQKRYLTALEATLHISPDKKGRTGLDALTGKTKILGYLGDYQKDESETSWETIEDTLYKNKRRIGANLNDSRLIARLRSEYEKSLDTLRPIKGQLARTDRLIDEVVYRLYGLTEEEIAVVEGEGSTTETRTKRLRTSSDKPQSIARESDPRTLAQVLETVAQHGPLTTRQLTAHLSNRNLRLGVDHLETIQREFRFLQWINAEAEQWDLTDAGKLLADVQPSTQTEAFARQLALANEQNNQQIISRLLRRMWDLNPDGQGSVISPQFPLQGVPNNLAALQEWLEKQLPQWSRSLRQQMAGYVEPDSFKMMTETIINSLAPRWDQIKPAERRSRLTELITDQFTDLMFGHIITPSDVDIWQRRLDWAGFTHIARHLAGVAGRVWFPVGAFRAEGGPNFKAVERLVSRGQTFYCHVPEGPEFQSRFSDTLYEGYRQQQQQERVEYVSLLAVRDWVCFRLKISHAIFERTLQDVFLQAVRGDLKYTMALEVDITPQERRHFDSIRPRLVIIDNIPRYIIAMRAK